MHHRKMTPITGGVQRRGCFSDVFPHDRHLADLSVAQAKLVVGETNGAGLVCTLRLLQGFDQEGDAARGLSAGHGEPAVHAPEIGQAGRFQPFAALWRRSQSFGRLADIILEEPGFSQRAPDVDLFVALQSWTLQCPDEERSRLGSSPALERLHRLAE
jgi:hypothetical protein